MVPHPSKGAAFFISNLGALQGTISIQRGSSDRNAVNEEMVILLAKTKYLRQLGINPVILVLRVFELTFEAYSS